MHQWCCEHRTRPTVPHLGRELLDYPKCFLRKQSLATVLPHPRFVLPTHLSTSEFLGIVLYEKSGEPEGLYDQRKYPLRLVDGPEDTLRIRHGLGTCAGLVPHFPPEYVTKVLLHV